MIDNKELVRLLKCAIALVPTSRYSQQQKNAGVIEGLLLCSGLLGSGEKYTYKQIEYETTTFFGKTITSTRTETYNEMMVQRAQDAIVKLESETV
jgi:hypothetical protein